MSSLVTPGGVPVNPKGLQKMSVTCVRCTKNMELLIPEMQILNTKTFSGLMWSHEDMNFCPNCGLSYLFRVMGYNPPQKDGSGGIVIGFIPVQPKQEQDSADDRVITLPPPDGRPS